MQAAQGIESRVSQKTPTLREFTVSMKSIKAYKTKFYNSLSVIIRKKYLLEQILNVIKAELMKKTLKYHETCENHMQTNRTGEPKIYWHPGRSNIAGFLEYATPSGFIPVGESGVIDTCRRGTFTTRRRSK